MKLKLMILAGLALAVFAIAATDRPMARQPRNNDPVLKQIFEVACPCGVTCQLKPIASQVTGSVAVRADIGIPGNIVEKTLTFKCPKCKQGFTQQAADEFVPSRPRAKRIVQGK